MSLGTYSNWLLLSPVWEQLLYIAVHQIFKAYNYLCISLFHLLPAMKAFAIGTNVFFQIYMRIFKKFDFVWPVLSIALNID